MIYDRLKQEEDFLTVQVRSVKHNGTFKILVENLRREDLF